MISFVTTVHLASFCRVARGDRGEGDTPRAPQAVFELGLPVLGICYGMQTIAEQLGGKVENGKVREFGYAKVRAHSHTTLLTDIQDVVTAEGHGILKM